MTLRVECFDPTNSAGVLEKIGKFERSWEEFCDGQAIISAGGLVAAYIMNKAEAEGIAYVLQAAPKLGYRIKREVAK